MFYIAKYYHTNNNFLVLRIDENGIYLCQEKDNESFTPWGNIKYVTFAVTGHKYNDDVKIAILGFDKKTYYLSLTRYFFCKPPKKAMREAYGYADDKLKIKFVVDPYFKYESNLFKLMDTNEGFPVLRQVKEGGSI